MNHEMVHVTKADVATEEDRRWRRFFLGKVSPQAEIPETLLYTYLTVPRFTAPRWYHEGGAVFMETWMGGGLGRAQGGYDEMVFRAMVRDDAHFYDPLGLVSRGIQVDFQVGANAYLYGTRFFTWLAYAYSPEKVLAWIKRDEGSARYYADQFEQVFGLPLDQAWQRLDRIRAAVPADAIWPKCASFPSRRTRRWPGTRVGSVSRMYYEEAHAAMLFGAFRYPGIVEYVGALNTRDGSVRQLADIKRAMLYRVASFAYDAASGTAFYTNDNLALPRPDGGRRHDGRAADAARECAHRRHRRQSGRQVVDGRAPRRTASRRSCGFPFRTTPGTTSHTFPYGVVPVRPRHLGRWPAAVGIDGGGQRRPVPPRVGARQASCTAT